MLTKNINITTAKAKQNDKKTNNTIKHNTENKELNNANLTKNLVIIWYIKSIFILS